MEGNPGPPRKKKTEEKKTFQLFQSVSPRARVCVCVEGVRSHSSPPSVARRSLTLILLPEPNVERRIGIFHSRHRGRARASTPVCVCVQSTQGSRELSIQVFITLTAVGLARLHARPLDWRSGGLGSQQHSGGSSSAAAVAAAAVIPLCSPPSFHLLFVLNLLFLFAIHFCSLPRVSFLSLFSFL